MSKMTQCDMILDIMMKHPEKEWWYASDFQKAPYFIGYEASARMSDVMREFPKLVEVGKDGRFRTLKINWDEIERLEKLAKKEEK